MSRIELLEKLIARTQNFIVRLEKRLAKLQSELEQRNASPS